MTGTPKQGLLNAEVAEETEEEEKGQALDLRPETRGTQPVSAPTVYSLQPKAFAVSSATSATSATSALNNRP